MEQQAQPQEQQVFNPTLKFEIPLADVEAILNALAEAPLKASLNAYMAIRTTAEQQVAAIQAEQQAKADGAGE